MRIIVANWSDGRVECYSTVTVFLQYNPGLNRETIMYHIARNNRPYIDENVKISRVQLVKGSSAIAIPGKNRHLKKPQLQPSKT